MSKKNEIPFGTFDNKLQEQEFCIPDGFGASIENGKIILRKIESKDEKIRKAIVEFFELQDDNTTYSFIPKKDILAWLEQQKHAITCSEEQMKVLDEVLNFAANHESPYWNDYIFETLNNLIRQLKN